jgi:hypothetical protein
LALERRVRLPLSYPDSATERHIALQFTLNARY